MVLTLGITLLSCLGAETSPTPTSTQIPVPTATQGAPATPDPAPVAVTNPRPVVFPNDETPHDNALEWWYYNGHLTDEDGGEYGFHFVVFQGRTDDAGVGYMAHSGLSDLAAGTHDQAGRFSFGEQAGQPADGFDFIIEDWTLNGSPGLHALATSIDDRSLELIMLPTKRVVLHDEDGFLESADGWTYYYSWTRMEATGTLFLHDGDRQVTGTAWMDHQWGDFSVAGYPTGWQWFAVQLDDGSELMVTEARDGNETPFVYGTLVRPDGHSIHLTNDDITLTTLGTWMSPHTQAEYPAGWRISVPEHRMEIELVPTIADQEITVAFPPRNIYWEGTASVSATLSGEPVPGNAFVELVGYVEPGIG